MRRFWELLGLALDSLRRTPLRVALTSLGIAIATGALVSMVGLAVGVEQRVEQPFQRMELFNRIDVVPKHVPASSTKNRESTTNDVPRTDTVAPPSLDAAALDRIAALPGVVLAYPDFRLNRVEVLRDGTSRKAVAVGLPAEAAHLRFVSDTLVAGRFFAPSTNKEVVVGRKLAHELGFESPEQAVGQTLTLKAKGLAPGTDRTFQLKDQEVKVSVSGVWNPPGGMSSFSAEGLVLPTDLIRDLPGVEFESALESLWRGRGNRASGYGRVVVRVKHAADLFVVEQRIRDMGFDTRTLLGQFKEMKEAFVILDLTLTAVGTVALVIAGLGILNTLLMTVLERYREIGIYLALGASQGDIRLLFLGEAALVGVLGGTGGLLLGRVVSWIIEVVVNAIARNNGIEEPILSFAFPLYVLVGAILFAFVISLLSGVYPASRAARVDPIRALRAE